MFSYRNKIILLFYSVILFTGFSLTAGNMPGNSKYKTVELKNHADYCQVYYSEKDLNATLDGEKIELNGILTLDKGKFQFVLTDPSGKTVYSKNYDTPGKYNFKKTFKNIKGKWQMKAHCFDSKFEYKILLKQKLFVSEKLTFPYKDEYRKYGDFIALADRRVFAVMAFVNACGYDEIVKFKYKNMLPLRKKIRELVINNLKKHPRKWKEFKDYFKLHYGCNKYTYFATSLDLKYPFKRIASMEQMENPWILTQLTGFLEILNDFWKTAELGKVWDSIKKDYIEYMDKFQLEKMQQQRNYVWEYLRMPKTEQYTFIYEVNPMMQRMSLTGDRVQNYLYSVGSPGSSIESYQFSFFSYLGDFLDQYNVDDYCSKYKDILTIYFLKAIKINPDINRYFDYKSFTENCLLRALNRRVLENYYKLKEPKEYLKLKAQLKKSLNWEINEAGYTLVKVFYNKLAVFEKNKNISFEDYIPELFKNIKEVSTDNIKNELEMKKMPPVVIKTIPECGAENIDPKITKKIIIYYNKQMSSKGYALCKGEENFPELTSKLEVKNKNVEFDVKLEYDKVYTLWLNDEKFKSFRDLFGNSAVPYLLYFKTKEKK